ncbi:hypothetical protein FA95DRAFT_1518318 [Auriscalpium vulgare]|uniref:Uncharacterized protein n=1 Tax=Auriscalpium vulgare TaxID=40419 RepID=A0ACB8RUW0_9AGAM|nr:hypothetical protein FA95DRAFT_1518318 [Auriscalpium vulgare]
MPVTTRSATGRLPTKRTLQAGDEENIDGDDGKFSDATSTVSSEAPETRPAKRAKNSKGKAVTKGPSRRVRGRLSALPSMPLDILFEIFGHLPPADLIHLTRVTKAFRQVLLSRDAMLLWKEAYELVPDVPSCPEDMSEPAWANLLFGGAHCHTCGSKPVNKILFILRRRACRSCMSSRLIEKRKVQTLFPSITWQLVCCLPYVDGQDCGTKRRGYNDYYWLDDLRDLQDELEALAKKYESHQSAEYTKAKEEIIDARKAALKVKTEHARTCAEWEEEKTATRKDELHELKGQRFSDIIKRFAALGYAESDVSAIHRHREVTAAKPMSDRVWTRILPILQPLLDNAKADRLAREVIQRKYDRLAYLPVAYHKYLKTLPVRATYFAPPASSCRSFPPAVQAIQEDEPMTLEFKERVDEAVANAAPKLLATVCTRANALLALLPETNGSNDAMPVVSQDIIFGDSFSAGTAFGLGLATSQFICGRGYCSVLDGFQALVHDHAELEYDERSKEIVLELLGLLGMDSTGTGGDLDRRDARFVCMTCSPSTHWCSSSYVKGRRSMGWRSCVSHSKSYHNGQTILWKLLDPEETALVKSRDSGFVDHMWGCGHCHLHNGEGSMAWQQRPSLLEHIKEKHAVEEPRMGVDYFRDLCAFGHGNYGVIEMEDDPPVPPADDNAGPCEA